MKKNEGQYEVGDWIVHLIYGVGQITKLEKRPIGGNVRQCYRVQTDDSTFWLPVDDPENKRVRPVASPACIQRTLRAFQRTPRKMDTNFKSRRKRIREALLDGDLTTDIKLVRDLNARQFSEGLNSTEQEAFNTITKRFLQEWSRSKGINLQDARQKLNQFLQESQNKLKEEQKSVAA